MDATGTIFTIGHGGRDFATFALLLRERHIQYLVDVRSQPYSRYQPRFNRETLRDSLATEGVHYIFMGDSLGGRPSDPSCYVEGRIDYAICRGKPWFHAGIERLRNGLEGGHRLALMCSEGKPEHCHRTKLISAELVDREIDVRHIDEAGRLISHNDVLRRITGGQMSLLPEGAPGAVVSRERLVP